MLTALDTEDTMESSCREEKGGLHVKSLWTAPSKAAEGQTGLGRRATNCLLAVHTAQWRL